ncbi:hypothetical protein HNR25_000838 [Streptomonospora salina]|uniref:Uncharacterized protein n=1 Tax=Streptomonospora salina TaxID=104205 RepID=A0A841E029_9ACTN|nr:hypothetical protein [Streptomonospora salina]
MTGPHLPSGSPLIAMPAIAAVRVVRIDRTHSAGASDAGGRDVIFATGVSPQVAAAAVRELGCGGR